MERPPSKDSSASSRSRNKMPSLYGRIEDQKLGTTAVDSNSVTTSGSGGSSSHSSSDQIQLLLQQRGVKSAASSAGLSRSEMGEAYRRLGHRLSQRVVGKDASSVVPQKARLQATPTGAFAPVVPSAAAARPSSSTAATGSTPSSVTISTLSTTHSSVADETGSGSQTMSYDRTHKVAKMHLKDHGEHHSSSNHSSILKKITCSARENYRNLMETTPTADNIKPSNKKKRSSPNSPLNQQSNSPLVSPQRHALSALALETSPAKSSEQRARSSASSKGLLQSVLEGKAVESLSTPSLEQPTPPIRGKCLTLPSEPVANDGYDNAEGNLIVYQHDVLKLVVRDMETKAKVSVEYKVLGILGQGTFAQVFKCLDIHRHRMVAVKVVKNRQAYTQQAAIEIDVFRVLLNEQQKDRAAAASEKKKTSSSSLDGKMVNLLSYCTYQNHLCLVFELLGLNLYEVLKRRQFRGLPLRTVRSLLQQAMDGVKELSQKSIVHCDLKPENILLTTAENETSDRTSRIKLIDFGSACFEGHTAHTYIQSRFYRSPEVLVGLPYDSAIDMWSLGCVAAELFLGLPILPGVHEHDQLRRICEMIGPIPEKMLGEGTKSTKYFVKYFPKSDKTAGTAPSVRTPSPSTNDNNDNGASSSSPPPPPRPAWRIKTHQEFLEGLTKEEIRKKGGLRKLEKQPTNRYFKRKKLTDIVMMHGGSNMTNEEKEAVGLFVHFLKGILDPDPWKRWTAFQASQHPFITGSKLHRRKQSTASATEGEDYNEFDIYWVPPWDPSICRRRLLHVQKTRERQQALRQKYESSRRDQESSPGTTGTSRVTAMAETMTLSTAETKARSAPQDMLSGSVEKGSPPPSIGPTAAEATPARVQPAVQSQISYPQITQPAVNAGSLSTVPVGVLPMDSAGAGVMSATPNNMPAYLATASSLSDVYPHPGTFVHGGMIPMASPSMHGINSGVGDFSMSHQQQLYLQSGAQSFSGLSHDGMQQLPIEAELGYALQRPGVFPGMGNDMASTPLMVPQMPGVPAGAFSPHQLHPMPLGTIPGPPMRSGSFSNPPTSAGRSGARRRRHTFTNQASSGLASHRGGAYMPSPTTSIREDQADYNLGNDNSMQSPSLAAAAGGSTSLLAQQLAEHSAATKTPQDPPHSASEPSMPHPHLMEGPASHPHGGYGLSPGMYGTNAPTTYPSPMNMYYYVAPDGTPVMMTPQQTMAQVPPVYGSHGSFQEHHAAAAGMLPMQYAHPTTATSAPIHSSIPPGLIPPQLAQPSFEEMEQHQPNQPQQQPQEQQQQQQAGIPYWSGVVPPPPRPPPPSSNNGMSM